MALANFRFRSRSFAGDWRISDLRSTDHTKPRPDGQSLHNSAHVYILSPEQTFRAPAAAARPAAPNTSPSWNQSDMRLATFSTNDVPRPGLIVSDGVLDISLHLVGAPRDMTDLIANWSQFHSKLDAISRTPADFKLGAAKLHPAVPRPRMIFAIGLNYADHIAEAGLEVPRHQIWFSKAVTAVSGPYDPIELPAVSEQLDYEGELVAVIGRRCRNVPRERASAFGIGRCARVSGFSVSPSTPTPQSGHGSRWPMPSIHIHWTSGAW